MSVTLSLRVTSDKRKTGVKPCNLKEEKLDLILRNLRDSSKDVIGASEYLDEVCTAMNLKSQVEILRKGFSVFSVEADVKATQERFYYMILVEILLGIDIKSSLRRGVVRILKDHNNTSDKTIKEIIALGLEERLSCTNDLPTVTIVTNTLCGCFDNFPLGVEGVLACKARVVQFITRNLKTCIVLLSAGEASGEVCECVHVLLRAALLICGLPSDPVDLSPLNLLSRQLMACSLLPLDTRTNSGLLAVNTARQHWLQMLKEQLSCEDDLTLLCVCSGILGSLSLDELSVDSGVGEGKQTALELIFSAILDVHHRSSLQSSVTLSVSRLLVTLSRLLQTGAEWPHHLLFPLLTFSWEHLEHVMDNVKHLAATLLHNTASLHSPDVDVHGAILTAVKGLPLGSRAHYVALTTLLGKLPVSQLINGDHDINTLYCHLNQETVSSHAVNAFQDLMKHHYKEIANKCEWNELWIKPLLLFLDKNPSIPLQEVLNKAVTVTPEVIKYVLSLPKSAISLGTTLLCLRHAHKKGLLKPAEDNCCKWKGLIDYSDLEEAIHHPDEQTRLSCLSLIVESPKTTEIFSPNELHIIIKYVSLNLNMELPASRQRNIALLCKLVRRLRDSEPVLMRMGGMGSEALENYALCRQALEQSCEASLFPGAAYGRRVTALNMWAALGVTPSPTAAAALLACLADSYEELKVLAMRLLVSTPGLLYQFEVPGTVVRLMERGLEQAGGVKPPDTVTAAYLLTTLSQVPFTPATLIAVSQKYPCCQQITNNKHIEHMSAYSCLLVVIDELEIQLKVAVASVLQAASSAPLYGLLFTARLILSQLQLSTCTSTAWCTLFSQLIELSFNCSQAVSSIVNSDSPEGHFPMDFDYDAADAVGEVAGGPQGVTSQMVLLCSWHTVKEVSLLLGFLAEECTITDSTDEPGLLSGDDLLRIGDHLTTLLAETKHRGAFEQAYVGFCKLVSRLWRLPTARLQALPREWLEETMQEISGNKGNLCATRRSAGIPFMIQALICTLLEVEGPVAIEPWVHRLLDMAESTAVPPSTHTHALNILRALFRNTQLGEAVAPFVEKAVIITITAFSSSSWMERNSATLLLSALMTRVFGVPRSKKQENLSWKNKMTGRIFFQRYPTLFKFFHEELRKAMKVKLHPSLYPVLLILGRLYPSSLEGTDSNIQLTEYIPDILVCASSNIYKTRALAAHAMVALLSLSHLDSLIHKVTLTNLNANFIHGLLLQIAYFLNHCDFKVDQDMLKNNAGKWIEEFTRLFSRSLSFMELDALFLLLTICQDKFFQLVGNDLWSKIIRLAREYLANIDSSLVFTSPRPRIYEFLLKQSVCKKDNGDVVALCCEMLSDNMYEVKHTILDFLSCLNSQKKCTEQFSDFFNNLPLQEKIDLNLIVFSNSSIVNSFVQEVFEILQSKQKNSYHVEDKSKLIGVLGNWKCALKYLLAKARDHPELKGVQFLVELCKESHDELALNALHCLTEIIGLKEFTWTEDDLRAVCGLLDDLNQPEITDLFNDALFNLLDRHYMILQQSNQPVNRLTVSKRYVELSDSRQWEPAVNRVTETESDDPIFKAVLLTAITLGHFLQNNIEPCSGRVFDKDEVIDDYEELELSQLAGARLKSLLASTPSLLDQPMEPSMSRWLAAETGLSGETLSHFIALSKLHILQLDPDDPCQFLNQGYQSLRLNRLKLNTFL